MKEKIKTVLNKRYMSIRLWEILLVFLLALIGIIIGTFLDKQISDGLVNTNSTLGAFVETLGESLAYITLPIGGTLCFAALYKHDKIWARVIGYILLVLGLGMATYFLGKSFFQNNPYNKYLMKPVWGYILAFVLMLIAGTASFFLVDKGDWKTLLKVGIVMLAAMGLQFGIMTLLKKIGGRPRYRFLVDNRYDVSNDGVSFLSWYQFQPFKTHGDMFKSWPSGHTATATQVMLLACMAPVLRFKFKNSDIVLFMIGLAYTLFIAFSRILYGAHFLSDVSFGMLVGTLLLFVAAIVGDKVFIAIDRKIKKPEEIKE